MTSSEFGKNRLRKIEFPILIARFRPGVWNGRGTRSRPEQGRRRVSILFRRHKSIIFCVVDGVGVVVVGGGMDGGNF